MNLLQPIPSIVILLAIGALTSGSPFTEDKDYDYDAANSDISNEGIADENAIVKGAEKEVMATPKFISSPQSVLVNEGDTIRLPCMVDRLEGFVMLWKKNMDIITVASQIIDKRVRLSEDKNGNHLIIGQATPEDSGEYTCQISAYKPTEITHKVLIRVKPEISTTPEEVLIVNEGSPASLECNAVSGTPTPEVKWVRKDTGEEEIVGTTLTFSQVTRQHAGYYLCMADNGFGPSPVQKEVRLQVHYAPEIEVEEAFIVTDMGEEQEISCVVESSPAAEVTWMKDGAGLDGSSPDTVLSQDQNRHSLLIVAVSKQSVGQYSCTASNTLGEATATADISGDAHPAVILSNHLSDHQHQFTLEWVTKSESEIEGFEVAVRKDGESDWKLYEVIVSNETDANNTDERESDFRSELLLTDLEADTIFQATVASRNKFGLSSHGDLFTFRTKAEEPEPVTETDPVPVTDESLVTEPVTEQVTEQPQNNKTSEELPSDLTASATQLIPFHTLFTISLLSVLMFE